MAVSNLLSYKADVCLRFHPGARENCQAMWTKVSWKHEDVSDRDFLRNREEYVALLILVYLCHFMIFLCLFSCLILCFFWRPGDWISIYFPYFRDQRDTG